MCSLQVDRTLFAKSSDRPPSEPQVVERRRARPAGGRLRTQYLTLDDRGAAALVGSRPIWTWGLEHGVNEHGVAIGNEQLWTVDDPRREPDALTGTRPGAPGPRAWPHRRGGRRRGRLADRGARAGRDRGPRRAEGLLLLLPRRRSARGLDPRDERPVVGRAPERSRRTRDGAVEPDRPVDPMDAGVARRGGGGRLRSVAPPVEPDRARGQAPRRHRRLCVVAHRPPDRGRAGWRLARPRRRGVGPTRPRRRDAGPAAASGDRPERHRCLGLHAPARRAGHHRVDDRLAAARRGPDPRVDDPRVAVRGRLRAVVSLRRRRRRRADGMGPGDDVAPLPPAARPGRTGQGGRSRVGRRAHPDPRRVVTTRARPLVRGRRRRVVGRPAEPAPRGRPPSGPASKTDCDRLGV